jgi:hypothetical protein
MGIGLGTRYTPTIGTAHVWTPALVLMRLQIMADVARRLEDTTALPRPRGYVCSMPEPPAGRDWEGRNGYGVESAPLRPVPPSDEEMRLHEATVFLVSLMGATDRVILWGGAVGKSWRRIAQALKDKQGLGTTPMSYEGVRRRWFRLLEDLAWRWTADGMAVDAVSRARFARFDARGYFLGKKKRKTKGRAFVNGEERLLGRIQAAEIDQGSMLKRDMYFRRGEWSAAAPKVGRDGVLRGRKNGVVKVDKKA